MNNLHTLPIFVEESNMNFQSLNSESSNDLQPRDSPVTEKEESAQIEVDCFSEAIIKKDFRPVLKRASSVN